MIKSHHLSFVNLQQSSLTAWIILATEITAAIECQKDTEGKREVKQAIMSALNRKKNWMTKIRNTELLVRNFERFRYVLDVSPTQLGENAAKILRFLRLPENAKWAKIWRQCDDDNDNNIA